VLLCFVLRVTGSSQGCHQPRHWQPRVDRSSLWGGQHIRLTRCVVARMVDVVSVGCDASLLSAHKWIERMTTRRGWSLSSTAENEAAVRVRRPARQCRRPSRMMNGQCCAHAVRVRRSRCQKMAAPIGTNGSQARKQQTKLRSSQLYVNPDPGPAARDAARRQQR